MHTTFSLWKCSQMILLFFFFFTGETVPPFEWDKPQHEEKKVFGDFGERSGVEMKTHIQILSSMQKKEKKKKAGFNNYLIFVDAKEAASVTLVSEAYNCERQSLTDGWVTKVCFFFWCCCFWRRFQYMSFSKLSNAGCRHWQTVLYCLCLFIKVRLCTQTWAVIKVRGKC